MKNISFVLVFVIDSHKSGFESVISLDLTLVFFKIGSENIDMKSIIESCFTPVERMYPNKKRKSFIFTWN